MSDFNEFVGPEPIRPRGSDPAEASALANLRQFFVANPEQVFFSRQLEVRNEAEFFHWITNRAIRHLEGAGLVRSETRALSTGGTIKLLWHRAHRYYRRDAAAVVKLVEEYAHPNIGGALGNHGELMVLEAFAKQEFVMKGRQTSEYKGKKWAGSGHNLDFIFERDNRAYGVEVKNMLGYMEYSELVTKLAMCSELGIRPVFVARMLPKVWVHQIWQARGFALILKYQLYPLAHKDLAKRVATELGLPVDAPRALQDGTMKRFVGWHVKNL